jgi:hypothetical protein
VNKLFTHLWARAEQSLCVDFLFWVKLTSDSEFEFWYLLIQNAAMPSEIPIVAVLRCERSKFFFVYHFLGGLVDAHVFRVRFLNRARPVL